MNGAHSFILHVAKLRFVNLLFAAAASRRLSRNEILPKATAEGTFNLKSKCINVQVKCMEALYEVFRNKHRRIRNAALLPNFEPE